MLFSCSCDFVWVGGCEIGPCAYFVSRNLYFVNQSLKEIGVVCQGQDIGSTDAYTASACALSNNRRQSLWASQFFIKCRQVLTLLFL